MDEYSEFASDEFDVKGWINATVASHLKLSQANSGAAETGVTSGSSAGTANRYEPVRVGRVGVGKSRRRIVLFYLRHLSCNVPSAAPIRAQVLVNVSLVQ